MPTSTPDLAPNTPLFCFFGASGARFVVTFGSVPTFSTGWQAYYLAFATRPHHSQIRSAAAGCN
jgi:hypothetical protein